MDISKRKRRHISLVSQYHGFDMSVRWSAPSCAAFPPDIAPFLFYYETHSMSNQFLLRGAKQHTLHAHHTSFYHVTSALSRLLSPLFCNFYLFI